jgi:hypothetical protein
VIEWKSDLLPDIHVFLPVESGTEVAAPKITGSAGFPAIISHWLSQAYNPDGHGLSSEPTGWELDYALKRQPELKGYDFKLVSGQEFITAPEPLPEGAVS